MLLACLRRTDLISRKNGRGGNYGETMVTVRVDVITHEKNSYWADERPAKHNSGIICFGSDLRVSAVQGRANSLPAKHISSRIARLLVYCEGRIS